MSVTLEEIAKATGFSVPTVSRALTNPDYPLSAATRQRINEVARQMGYMPNLTARSLRTDQSHTIGIIVDDILSPFAPRILRGIQDVLIQAVLPEMKARGFGRVINIGTESFDLGNPRNANYVASKGAMQGLTRSWANELGSFGITVNTVAPGWIARENHGFVNGEKTEGLRNYQVGLPLTRVGTPDDIGATVAFIASDGAGFITGQKVAVNGGKTLL